MLHMLRFIAIDFKRVSKSGGKYMQHGLQQGMDVAGIPATYIPAARPAPDSARTPHSACHKPAGGRADP
jgi:hypothetical protein